ncbi:MAG: class I SAM-dependent methyltransferase [Nocardia sp.]|nr:class I SAM-dependent methyltransferase [Nocardia sp.]
MTPSALRNPHLDQLIAQLQQRSTDQIADIGAHFAARADRGEALDPGTIDDDAAGFLADKLVALDHDKAMFCHRLCLALRAKCAVEVGTSYGVSTLYLAQAIHLVATEDGRPGVVIGTEHEPAKAAQARTHLACADLERYVDLREGDLRETLQHIEQPIDFALIDIWPVMARPAIELIAPHLRRGAVVIVDNTENRPPSYRELFDFIDDPANGFTTQTLPFEGGLEMAVKL